ncbi:PTS N-acetylgalactosamine transporter subunit IIC [Endozoicomonas lisbonensis]|uniref:PTS system N-acetylgalactosamine-specific IIC component n=1 Tax=Endozoicomonas lisbonensis TaxID=3120522 RepID=A0ABV2SB24_9GAMM
MLFEALMIALLAGIAGVDLFNGLTHMHRPLITGPIVGFILGDVQTGLITGASLELVWMGMAPLAGAQPPNVVIGGIIGVAFAILTQAEPQAAIGIAVPFAVAVQGLITLLFTAFSPVMHRCDEMAAKADWKGIDRVNYMGMSILFSFYFILAFLPIFFGAEQAQTVVEVAPEWLMSGLGVAGGLMPAIGFSMLMKIMFKQSYIPYFIVGFLAAAYLELPVIAIALVGIAIALADYFQSSRVAAQVPQQAGGVNDGI